MEVVLADPRTDVRQRPQRLVVLFEHDYLGDVTVLHAWRGRHQLVKVTPTRVVTNVVDQFSVSETGGDRRARQQVGEVAWCASSPDDQHAVLFELDECLGVPALAGALEVASHVPLLKGAGAPHAGRGPAWVDEVGTEVPLCPATEVAGALEGLSAPWKPLEVG